MIPTDLIIDLTVVYNHKKDFLTYLFCLINANTSVEWTQSYYRCGEIVRPGHTKALVDYTGLTAETIKKYLNTYANDYEFAGKIAVVPWDTYNRLISAVQSLSAAERNGTVRLFFYYLCQCWNFQDFSRTKTQIAADLETKVDLICRRTRWLVEHGFIAYKHKHMHVAGKPSKAAVYQLYVDEVPSHYATNEWFIGHLAARETVSMDAILQDFKNSF